MNEKPVIILGGGLWGGLLAYRWKQLHPKLEFLLVESQEHFGGNHTWCFHESDISTGAKDWINPFIVQSWDGYKVKFPSYEKTLKTPYHCVSSEKFEKLLLQTFLPDCYRISTHLTMDEAITQSSWVVDARGFFHSPNNGYQKFLGLELELKNAHGLQEPILMDALVPQTDGFRFMYSLPFGTHKVLIEDTRYSLSEEMNNSEFKEEILSYARKQGWQVRNILREERGILPLPISAVENKDSEAVQLGGIFHDTTGYSFPDAVRLIDLLLEETPSRENFERIVRRYRQERTSDRRFFRLLNWFMFRASTDEERYRMLEFFYRHSPKLISKFYSGKLTTLDKLKFFIGRPPISILHALREILV